MSYHILSDKEESLIYDGIRTPLIPIDAWEIKKETVDIQAPFKAGEYIVEIELAKEGIAWFSAQGMPTLKIPLNVNNSAELNGTSK